MLVSQSDYFATALTGPFKEAKSAEIVLDAHDDSIIRAVLQFIYTGYVSIDRDCTNHATFLADLRAAAEYFSMPKLKSSAQNQFLNLLYLRPKDAFITAPTAYSDTQPSKDDWQKAFSKIAYTKLDEILGTDSDSQITELQKRNRHILMDLPKLSFDISIQHVSRTSSLPLSGIHGAKKAECATCKQTVYASHVFKVLRCPECLKKIWDGASF
ncbi:MAG: hypothetical protein Q9162_000020 [Coniocarpon cinnabarinum]